MEAAIKRGEGLGMILSTEHGHASFYYPYPADRLDDAIPACLMLDAVRFLVEQGMLASSNGKQVLGVIHGIQ